jgi:RIO-like serine/threonine protein kinase
MKLVRDNKEKHRKVFFCGDSYLKIWTYIDSNWIKKHVKILDQLIPGYVLDFGNNWISYKVVPGIPASMSNEFPHTLEFKKKIYDFCFDQIKSTCPWYHGDWTLSNIIIDGDNITMVDWDNIGQYSETEVYLKLKNDLTSAFGDF